jgi:hypothetical protein
VGIVVKPDKSRYVYLYLPSSEDKKRWDKLASDAGVPLSKFVIEIVENALMEESEFKPRTDMINELGSLRDEVRKLRDDLKLKNIVIDKYESELKRYRSATFLEGGFEGARKYNQELVELLKQKTVIDSYRILEELGIDPRETELVKAVSYQLDNLEAYGLVESTSSRKEPSAERIIDRFKKDCTIRGMSPRTVEVYVYNVKTFPQIHQSARIASAGCG